MLRGMVGGRSVPGHRPANSSASSSDDSIAGSEGGAPLDSSTPEKNGSPEENEGATSPQSNTSPVLKSSELSDEDEVAQLSTTSSVENIPPTLTLAGYPGPGAFSQHQANTGLLLPAAPVVAGVPVPVTAPQDDGRTGIPGSTTQTFISAMQAMSFNPSDENLHPAHKALRDQTCKLQARIWGLRQGMYRQGLVPRDFLISFDYDVQELVNNTVKLNQSADVLAGELKDAQLECKSLQAKISDLERDIQSWEERHEHLETAQSRLAARSSEDMKTIQFLTEKLRQTEMAKTILQDQVDGRRQIWMDVHRDPLERAAAFNSLTRASTPLSGPPFALTTDQSAYPGRGSGSTRTSSLHSGNVRPGSGQPGNTSYLGVFSQGSAMPYSHSGASQHGRRLSSVPSGSGRSNIGHTNSGRYPANTPSNRSSVPKRSPLVPASTELGSPNERKRDASTTLAKPRLGDEEYKKWTNEFIELFSFVRGLCQTYFHALPQIDTDLKSHIKAQAKGILWDYICRVCQPGEEQDRGDRAISLLEDDETRPFLMQRLIVQHMVVYIFSYEGWKDYSDDVDAEMAKFEKELKDIDPRKTYERQAIIDRRAELVNKMLTGPNAAAFRNHKLNQHHQQLKTMIAPFLTRDKKSSITQEAFYDMFTAASMAWELSAKLFRSRLTFQYIWNDGNVRFSTETHQPLLTEEALDPISLQQGHRRVKLCVTPAVILRSDQDMSISTKTILKSGVLLTRH